MGLRITYRAIQWVKGQGVERGQRVTTNHSTIGLIGDWPNAISDSMVPYPAHTRACARVNPVSNLLCRIQLATVKWNDQIGKASPNKGRLSSSTVVVCLNDCAKDMLRSCSEHSPSIKPLISPVQAFQWLGHRLALDHKRKAPKGAYMRVRG